MPIVTKSIITPFSSRQLFNLVTDVVRYPIFIKGCRSAHINQVHDDGYTATLEFEFKGLRKSFTTRNVTTPYSLITMSLVDGPFRQLQGKWMFTDLNNQGCRVEFELEYEMASKLLEKSSTPLLNFISNSMVNSFYEEGTRKFNR